MANWERRFWNTMARSQLRWDRIKLAVKRRTTGFGPLALVGYRGHGGGGRIRVAGRLVEDKGIDAPRPEDGALHTMLSTIRRFESDEIPGARVVARYGETAVAESETDHDGYFRLTLDVDDPIEPGWSAVELELLESLAGGAGLKSAAEILAPDPAAEFAIISDIDDTVLKTQATELMTQLRLTLLQSGRLRSPMPGATPLYRTLEGGPDREGHNPFFYVSNSGWGLYDLIVHFMEGHDLPKGPLYLQDIAVLEPKSPQLGNQQHKQATIEQLLDDYPDLDFVLIGDSGQDDPETYRDLVEEHTDRIRAVLVRAVTPPERDAQVRRIIQEIADMGVAAAAAESSVSLARAAADFELIPDEAIAEVREAMVAAEEA